MGKELDWITILDHERLEGKGKKANAFRIDTVALLFITAGSGSVTINLRDYDVEKHDFVTIMHGSLIELHSWSSDFSSFYINFPTHFTRDLDLWKNTMNSLVMIMENPVLRVSNEEHVSFLENYCSMLYEICLKHDISYKQEIIKNMLEAIMFAVGGLYKDFSDRNSDIQLTDHNISRSQDIYTRFLYLVTKNYEIHRDIAYYAGELCITPKHLGYVVKSISGVTASDTIVEAVMMDAKSKLKSSDMSVGQIAESLNFPNPSFFCKYFRKHAGTTPKQYRDLQNRQVE